MPPRKRLRVSQAATPTAASQTKTPTPPLTTNSSVKPDAALPTLDDPWTDDEELGLFKGLIACKPTGIHKHFRLLALRQFLLDGQHIHPRAAHTQPEGIWRKLNSLYDLQALDEREDARQLEDLSVDSDGDDEKDGAGDGEGENDVMEEGENDGYSEAANKIQSEEFRLPESDFGELVWRRRLMEEKQGVEESPFLVPEVNLAEQVPKVTGRAGRAQVRRSETMTASTTATPVSVRAKPMLRAGVGVEAEAGKVAAARATARVRGTPAAATVAPRRSTRRAESLVEEDAGGVNVEETKSEAEASEEATAELSETSTPARLTRASRGARGLNASGAGAGAGASVARGGGTRRGRAR